MESNRQIKVAKQIQKDLAEIFRLKASVFSGNLISVTAVKMTADLSIASVHLSIFPATDKMKVLNDIKADTKAIRFDLGKRVRNQLRKIPELNFYLDNSLDQAERITELLKK